jgi:hypothetical protein
VRRAPADAGAALLRVGDEHPDLVGVVRGVVDVDEAGDLVVAGRDHDLPGSDQLRELRGRRAGRPLVPEPALGREVDAVDEVGQLRDQLGVAAGRRNQHADVERVVQGHASRMRPQIERDNR